MLGRSLTIYQYYQRLAMPPVSNGDAGAAPPLRRPTPPLTSTAATGRGSQHPPSHSLQPPTKSHEHDERQPIEATHLIYHFSRKSPQSTYRNMTVVLLPRQHLSLLNCYLYRWWAEPNMLFRFYLSCVAHPVYIHIAKFWC